MPAARSQGQGTSGSSASRREKSGRATVRQIQSAAPERSAITRASAWRTAAGLSFAAQPRSGLLSPARECLAPTTARRTAARSSGGSLPVTNSSLAGNSAPTAGAIYTSSGASVSLRNVAMWGNAGGSAFGGTVTIDSSCAEEDRAAYGSDNVMLGADPFGSVPRRANPPPSTTSSTGSPLDLGRCRGR